MSAQLGVNAYRQTEVRSRTPVELVVMLYDGALRFLAIAREGFARGDIKARRDALSKVIAIVSELQSTLNLREGGDIALTLDQLYAYVNTRIMDAVLHKDGAPLDEVQRILETLRDGWNTIKNEAA